MNWPREDERHFVVGVGELHRLDAVIPVYRARVQRIEQQLTQLAAVDLRATSKGGFLFIRRRIFSCGWWLYLDNDRAMFVRYLHYIVFGACELAELRRELRHLQCVLP